MKTPSTLAIPAGLAQLKLTGTFARLLASAGLDKVLEGEGDFTVFAPTDEAFAALAPETLAALESDPAQLRAVLEYHILPVGRELPQLRNGKMTTLEGTPLTASVTDDGVSLDHANTVGHPLRCANGVIHQLDAVLLPGFTRESSAQARADSAWSGRRRIPPAFVAPKTTPAQDAEALFKQPRE